MTHNKTTLNNGYELSHKNTVKVTKLRSFFNSPWFFLCFSSPHGHTGHQPPAVRGDALQPIRAQVLQVSSGPRASQHSSQQRPYWRWTPSLRGQHLWGQCLKSTHDSKIMSVLARRLNLAVPDIKALMDGAQLQITEKEDSIWLIPQEVYGLIEFTVRKQKQ